jgi:hypothetical protein
VDAADGTVAATLDTGGTAFAQTVFADKYLFATAGGRG